jgi:hypothetical protein
MQVEIKWKLFGVRSATIGICIAQRSCPDRVSVSIEVSDSCQIEKSVNLVSTRPLSRLVVRNDALSVF